MKNIKIAYYAPVDFGVGSGVVKKIVAQAEAWEELGAEVKIFAYTASRRLWSGLPLNLVVPSYKGNLCTRLFVVNHIIDEILAWKPDVVYMRIGFYYPSFERLWKRIPTVVEVNTKERDEARLHLSYLKYRYHVATVDRFFKKAAGIVCVTFELAEMLQQFKIPITVISNGIKLSEYKVLPPPSTSDITAVFIGHAWEKSKYGERRASYKYHGLDKVIQLSGILKNWQFVIIGFSASELPTIPPNVRFFGYLQRAEYEPILGNADVGIGSLSLYLKGMNEACPIKVREYLAFGLPVIAGYRDTDFLEGAPFLLQLPNTEDNVVKNITVIERFVMHWKGKRVPREAIRHLDIHYKEAARLAFLRSVL
ncbi:MAG: glycosyltransferase family 4 protein [Candidatus Hadarchaeum sp.]|uniref:glycosyltransferase family 4 protein n=1 Tax=Candidatus Hadarchaeum sp. TaxID=2883567 RepID=UPI003180F453